MLLKLLYKIKIYWEDIWKGTLVRLLWIVPISKRKIVFCSYHGTKYDDNPRYISDKLIEFDSSVDVVWIVKNTRLFQDDRVRFVKEGSIRSIFELATAKIWVDNVRKDIWVGKRHNQYYIQTWHGGTALKKIEKDAEEKLGKSYIRRAKLDSKLADVLISTSEWNTALYKRAFWFDGKILESGAPRSDPYYQYNDNYGLVVRKYFKIPNDYKIILYAPTFRNNDGISVYNIDYERLLINLSKFWGGKWKIIIRLHPNCTDIVSSIHFTDDILNGSFYPDINDLIISSSLLITDYSSCMFDALEANKIVILYASDTDSYMNERGFYFQFEELPFSVSKNNEELETNIKRFNNELYQKNTENFKAMLGLFSDGRSSERVASFILQHLNNTGKT